LDHSRRSINTIIVQQFEKLTDPLTIKGVALCSLATVLGVKVPFSILRKILNKLGGRCLSQGDVFDVALTRTNAFIEDYYDNRNNCFFLVFHHILAKQLARKIGVNAMDDVLMDVANSADLTSRLEAHFVGSIFIGHGVREVLKNKPVPFSVNGLISALEQLKLLQPARPVLHHLARLYQKKNAKDKRIFELLDDAMAEPKRKYVLAEDKSYILNTLASFKWEANEAELVTASLDDYRIKEIFDLLERVKKEDSENLYPYDVQARIIKKMVGYTENFEKKMKLITEGIKIVTKGMDLCVDDWESEERLESLLIEFMAGINFEKAKQHAQLFLEKNKNGAGFYALARYSNLQGKEKKEVLYLIGKAMEGESYPAETIAFKLAILLKNNNPNYSSLVELVDNLSSRGDFSGTWRSSLQKGVIYVIAERYEEAVEQFAIARRRAPRFLQKHVEYFWMEGGRRKMFRGKISSDTTLREGGVYSHNVGGWNNSIFFDPRYQKYVNRSNVGMSVNFELGFSPMGPIAFDVRPIGHKA